jgi:AcrR family transcriptional regulator
MVVNQPPVQEAVDRDPAAEVEPDRDEVVASPRARDAIKKIAAQLIAERGYHSTSLRQLANEAGITLGTLYHYFPSKEELLSELIDDAMRPLLETLDRVGRRAEADPVDALRQMVESFILIALEELGRALVLIADNELNALSPAPFERALRQRDEYEHAMLDVVEAGVRRGVFDVPNPKLAVYAMLAICNSVPRWYRFGGALSPEAAATVNAELALRVAGVRERAT